MAKFHPDLDLITDYSAGSLPLAQSACVSVHVSNCVQCQRLARQLTDLAAAMFEELEAISVGDVLLDTVLARLDEEPVLAPEKGTSSISAMLQRLVNADFSDLSWKKIGSALRISYLHTGDSDHEFALYHIKAGGKIPEHTHRGSEMTLVLEGGFSDANGSYHEGDFIFRRSGDVHSPTALQSQDCICLSVLDAPLKFTTWKFRWMNPFLKLRTAG
ncbi:MAG: putative transcriptional regulator [Halioglobus sp.]|jgi:putative transcriptional regulator